MLILTYSVFALKSLKNEELRVKIRYTKEGMKTASITMRAKQKSIYIEEKVIKEAELPARTKKQVQNNHYQQEMKIECIN